MKLTTQSFSPGLADESGFAVIECRLLSELIVIPVNCVVSDLGVKQRESLVGVTATDQQSSGPAPSDPSKAFQRVD